MTVSPCSRRRFASFSPRAPRLAPSSRWRYPRLPDDREPSSEDVESSIRSIAASLAASLTLPLERFIRRSRYARSKASMTRSFAAA